MSKIVNAEIVDVSISMANYACLTFNIHIHTQSFDVCVGGYCNGHGYLGADYWYSSGIFGVALMKIMDTVGVEKWENLKGKHIRVVDDGWGSKVVKIGHFIEDKWFDLDEFFKNNRGEIFTLDERPKKEEDNEDSN